MISKSVTREQFEVRSELEVVHIPTGIVFRVHPYTDPHDRLQSIKGTSIYSDFECRGERRSCKVRFF